MEGEYDHLLGYIRYLEIKVENLKDVISDLEERNADLEETVISMQDVLKFRLIEDE